MNFGIRHLMILFATPFIFVGSGIAQSDTNAPVSSHTPSTCCVGFTGNIDNDPAGLVDIADLTVFIDHLFINFPPLACPQEANIDGDKNGIADITDLTVFIDHLFITFPPTAVCQVSYVADIQPILVSKCAIPTCHGANANGGGFTMGAFAEYNTVRNAVGDSGMVIIPEVANQSNLYLKTTDNPPFGDQMPPTGIKLTLIEQALIRDWIAAGAFNN